MENSEPGKSKGPSFLTPLIAGGLAGLSVDVALFPLDTLKTRLQSEQGFYKAGGFRGVYRGLSAVVAGSMPTSALFFVSYELVKGTLQPLAPPQYAPFVHMLAASVGEVVACLVRVPTEIVKQRKQTFSGSARASGFRMLLEAYRTEGLCQGVYRGFFSTVLRDIPFSFIELPVWEWLKERVRQSNGGNISSVESALCGSLAGAFAGALTTPLDLAKTRIVLAEQRAAGAPPPRVHEVLARVYAEAGARGLFAGLAPRVLAFTVGGFVFFGAYEVATAMCRVALP